MTIGTEVGGWFRGSGRRSPVVEPAPSYADWDYETGTPNSPVPTGSLALQYQAYAERLARQRQGQLWDDAHRSMQLAEQSLTQYRNNAASVLRSGVYQNRAQLFANQAQTIEPADVLSGFREEQRQRALRDAKKARRRAESMQIIGAVVGIAATAATGGAAAGLLAGVGAGAGLLANRERGDADAALQEAESPSFQIPRADAGLMGGQTIAGGQIGPQPAPGFREQQSMPQSQGQLSQGQQGPPVSQGLRLEGGTYGQQQGPPGQQQRQPQGPQGAPGQQATAFGGQQPQQGQQMRMGQPGQQQQQQGMGGGMDVVGTASRLAYASVVADDDALDQIEVGLAVRTQLISSGRYAEAV